MIREISNIWFLALFAVAGMQEAMAKDFGIKGHTSRIIEEPFLQMIKSRLQKVDMEKEREKMILRAKDRIGNPVSVKNISSALKDRIFYFDPTYTVEKDIILPCGRILHTAGTQINPLDHMDLNRRLFFIDSNDKAQVKWLKNQLSSSPKIESVENKIILVSGSPIELEKDLSKEVYFDQNGELTTRFGIIAVPAIVEQEERLLKIKEIVVD